MKLLTYIKEFFIKLPKPLNKNLEKKHENIRKLERIIACLKNCNGGQDGGDDGFYCSKCPVIDYCSMFTEIIDNFGIGLTGEPVKKISQDQSGLT